MCLPFVDCGDFQVCSDMQAESLQRANYVTPSWNKLLLQAKESEEDKIYLQDCLCAGRLLEHGAHGRASLCNLCILLMFAVQDLSSGAGLQELAKVRTLS